MPPLGDVKWASTCCPLTWAYPPASPVALNTATSAISPKIVGSKSIESAPELIWQGSNANTLICTQPPAGAVSLETIRPRSDVASRGPLCPLLNCQGSRNNTAMMGNRTFFCSGLPWRARSVYTIRQRIDETTS